MRNSILQSALSVSLESEDLPMEGAELNPVTETTTVQVDEVLEEVREAGDAVEEHEEAVEELDDAAESLESLIASLESAIADGGMSPQTADVHNRAMANAVRRLPIDAGQFTVSNESFGGTGDKLVASQEALEGAKEMLSKIWNAIKNAVISAWKAVVTFVATIGKSGPALVKAGAVLKAQANGITGEAKQAEISVAGIDKYTQVGGAVKSPISGQLKLINVAGKKVSAAVSHAATEVRAMTGKFMTGSIEASFDDGVEYGKKVFPNLPTEELPGGKEIQFDTEALVYRLVQKSELSQKDGKIATPNKAEIQAIASEIIAIGKMLIEFDTKYFKTMQKELDAFIAAQDKLVKKADYGKEETASYRANLKAFKQIYRMTSSLGPATMGHAANSAKAAFSFGKKAVAAYK